MAERRITGNKITLYANEELTGPTPGRTLISTNSKSNLPHKGRVLLRRIPYVTLNAGSTVQLAFDGSSSWDLETVDPLLNSQTRPVNVTNEVNGAINIAADCSGNNMLVHEARLGVSAIGVGTLSPFSAPATSPLIRVTVRAVYTPNGDLVNGQDNVNTDFINQENIPILFDSGVAYVPPTEPAFCFHTITSMIPVKAVPNSSSRRVATISVQVFNFSNKAIRIGGTLLLTTL